MERNSIVFASILFAIAGCGGQPEEKRHHEWPSDVPREDIGEFSCTTKSCFVVSADTTMCSVDAATMPERDFFNFKSTIRIPQAAYPLASKNGKLQFQIGFSTPLGDDTLTQNGGIPYEVLPEIKTGDAYITRKTFATIQKATEPRGDDFSFRKLLIRTPRIELWNDEHFRLGDPKDIWWWMQADRRLVGYIDTPTRLMPNLTLPAQIWYAPCEMHGAPDDTFTFDFGADGNLSLRARAALGGGNIGSYMGRLLSASGKFRQADVLVEDWTKLAFFGSSSVGAYLMPYFAVRFSENNNPDETCGIALQPTGEGEIGWDAFEISCQDTLGQPLVVHAATAPDKYEMP